MDGVIVLRCLGVLALFLREVVSSKKGIGTKTKYAELFYCLIKGYLTNTTILTKVNDSRTTSQENVLLQTQHITVVHKLDNEFHVLPSTHFVLQYVV